MSRLSLVVAAALLALAGCKQKEADPAAPPAPVSGTAAPAGGTAPPAPTPAPAPTGNPIVDAADRSPDDRALDEGRKPAEFLAFTGVGPGMKVAELMAGGGYTSELLARAVGPSGKVYGQNPKVILEKFAEKPWAARLAKPVNAGVVRVDRELDDPLPPEAKDLDLIVANLVYHDFVWMNVDRARMNQALFAALKPGGRLYIADHHAAAGAGVTAVQTLHRIEPAAIRQEVEAAGFVLAKEGDFLRHPDDTRDWSTSPGAAGEKRGHSDRFVLLFEKPGA
ncbi:MAG TPA: SAM-dependent methyltransferase [Kofleriaceae bacterium]|jgi:predicted methyltransferase|nr:SAM-dependent methyltransferase [Kofleriaceae bacterium]